MNTPLKHDPQHAATTTEELIVQYLDGELRRKELESVLFGRLAESEEARMILHEHLVLRGAIQASAEDERFLLSDSLDRKTRTRIEQALKFSENAPAIQTNAATRRTSRWVLRPSLAVLAILAVIGTTWFVTHNTDTPVASNLPAKPMQIAQAPTQESSQVQITEAPKAVEIKHEIVHAAKSVLPSTKSSTSPSAPQQLAQNSAAPKQEVKPQEPNPADLMISKRYARFLNAAAKNEVVITGRDRM